MSVLPQPYKIVKLCAGQFQDTAHLTPFRVTWLNCVLTISQTDGSIRAKLDNYLDSLVSAMDMRRIMISGENAECNPVSLVRSHAPKDTPDWE
jgi:hypothetical protein